MKGESQFYRPSLLFPQHFQIYFTCKQSTKTDHQLSFKEVNFFAT